MNRFSGILLAFLFLFTSKVSFSQFVSIEIGVSGLTCSACTRSVEKNIRKLDFIKEVKVNLEQANGKIVLKDGANVSIDKVARAVENAGYSVNYLKAVFHFQSLAVSDNFCYTFQSTQFQFVKVGNRTLSGDVELKVIGKSFMNGKEYKTWDRVLVPLCISLSQKLLFVTI